MNIMTNEEGNVVVSIPIDFRTVCGRRRVVVGDVGEVTDIDRDETHGLLKAFARARSWTRLLECGTFPDVKSLASGLSMDRAAVVRILRLANLSPRIFRAVVRKELPDGFTYERLCRVESDLWEDQEREVGLAPEAKI